MTKKKKNTQKTKNRLKHIMLQLLSREKGKKKK